MRIDYNILWFENDEGWLKQAVKGIGNLLDDYGFRLKETNQKDGSKIEDLIVAIQSKILDIDMIFMDFTDCCGFKYFNMILMSFKTIKYLLFLFFCILMIGI